MKKGIRFILFQSLLTIGIYPAMAQVNLTSIDDTISYTGNPGLTTVSVTIVNEGDSVAGTTFVSFYVAIDSVISTEDSSLIWSQQVPSMPGGDTLIIDTTIDLCNPIIQQNLPYVIQYGLGFNIGYIIDSGNLQEETNENDNTGVTPGAINMICNVGISDIESAWLLVYPNPGDGRIRLSASIGDDSKLSVERMTGERIVDDLSVLPHQEEIDLSFLTPGQYIVRLTTEEKLFFTLLTVSK